MNKADEPRDGPPAKRWTRRRVLAVASVSGAVLVTPYRLLGYEDELFAGLQHLSPARGVILADIIDALLPAAAVRTPEARAERVRFLDGYLSGLSDEAVGQVRMLLVAVEHSTLPFGGHLHRFTRLATTERIACLDGWRASSWGLRRLAFRALVGLAFMSYYRTQAAFDSIGYSGPVARSVVAPPASLARYDALVAAEGLEPAFR